MAISTLDPNMQPFKPGGVRRRPGKPQPATSYERTIEIIAEIHASGYRPSVDRAKDAYQWHGSTQSFYATRDQWVADTGTVLHNRRVIRDGRPTTRQLSGDKSHAKREPERELTTVQLMIREHRAAMKRIGVGM